MSDLIDRQAAIEALWKALYEYEDKTEKQFQESDELDIGDWLLHRIFVQNMSDIDRQTILNLQPAQLAPDQNGDLWITVPDIDKVTRIFVQESKSKFCRIFYEEQPERIRGRWTRDNACSECGCQPCFSGDIHNYNFCPNCGADMREVTK